MASYKTIQTNFVAIDRMTSTLNNITNKLNLMTSAVKKTEKVIGTLETSMKTLDSSTNQMDNAIKETTSNVTLTNSSLKIMQSALNGTSRSMGTATKSTNDFNESMRETFHVLGTVYYVYNMANQAISGIARAFSTVSQLSTELSLLSSKLTMITGSAQNANLAFSGMFKVAQEVRAPIMDLGQSISMLGIMAGGAFDNFQDLLTFMKVYYESAEIGGASSEYMAAGLLQLAQALGSGRLQGQDLRALTNDVTNFVNILAQGLGYANAGELRKAAATTDITTKQVVDAVLSMADSVDASFTGIQQTTEQSMNKINNSLMGFIATLQEPGEPLDNLQKQMSDMANWFNTDAASGFYDMVGAIISLLVSGITAVTNAFMDFFTFIDDNMATMVGIFAAAATIILYIVYTLFAKIEVAIADFLASHPIILVTAIIVGAVVGLWYKGFAALEAGGATTSDAISGAFASMGTALEIVFLGIVQFGLQIFTTLEAGIIDITIDIEKAFDSMMNYVDDHFSKFINNLIDGLNMFIGSLNVILKLLTAGLIQLPTLPSWSSSMSSLNSDIASKQQKSDDLMNAVNGATNNTPLGRVNAQIAQLQSKYTAQTTYGVTSNGQPSMSLDDLQSQLTGIGMGSAGGAPSLDTSGLSGGGSIPTVSTGGTLDSIGSVDNPINLSDESIKLLKDIRDSQYIQFTYQPLAPEVHVHVTGGTNDDSNSIASAVEQVIIKNMQDERKASYVKGQNVYG